MGSKDTGWRQQAEESFFSGHLSIVDIAALTGVSRKSLSAYLRTVPGYEKERQSRKAANAAGRQAYKNQKNREYRAAGLGCITPETIRREHDMAAIILSREKYF